MFLTTKNNKKGKTKTYNGQTNYNKDNIEQQATGKSKQYQEFKATSDMQKQFLGAIKPMEIIKDAVFVSEYQIS